MTDAAPPAPTPPRYAVQRPKGKKWDTLHIDDDRDNVMTVFRQVVTVLPKSYVRVIIVEYDSGGTASDFRWRLVELYDPYAAGARSHQDDEKRRKAKIKKAAKSGAARARAPGETVPPPVRMYAWAILLGLLGGAAVFYWIGLRPPA
ncbi:MAG TPA: hypothetical protein VEB64_05750 [Azospirillaceae bacterium]|nr:hypothetical protein [Azospirillaceae bacterium]